MLRRLAAALLIAAAPSFAQAQFAVIAPDTPLGDATDRIVNTNSMLNTLLQGLPLAAGNIFIGSASNFATPRVMSGDCTISQTGILTCTQAAGNFAVNGNLNVTGTSVYTGLATFNGGATINGTLTVNGWIVDRYGGVTVNGTKQPTFGYTLPLLAGGIVFQDTFGLNVVRAPFPNQILMSNFPGLKPAWNTMSGDCTISAGVITCTKVNGSDQTTAWTPYTPTVTSQGGSFTTVSATGRYKQLGKTVQVEIDVTITTAGTATGYIAVTLPFVSASNKYVGSAFEYTATSKSGASIIVPAISTNNVLMRDATGTTFIASGSAVAVSLNYELP